MKSHQPYVDALRLLYILVNGSIPNKDSKGADHIFIGETKLCAFDFWMRNPDYLADELLNLYETTGNSKALSEAQQIFSNNEPDLRRHPMIRWRFGAYERMDDSLSKLRARNLIIIPVSKNSQGIEEKRFLVREEAFDFAARITSDFPVLSWYDERSKLVAWLAKDKGGTALKRQQYQQIEYHETQSGEIIPSITSRVQTRLNRIEEKINNSSHATI